MITPHKHYIRKKNFTHSNDDVMRTQYAIIVWFNKEWMVCNSYNNQSDRDACFEKYLSHKYTSIHVTWTIYDSHNDLLQKDVRLKKQAKNRWANTESPPTIYDHYIGERNDSEREMLES